MKTMMFSSHPNECKSSEQNLICKYMTNTWQLYKFEDFETFVKLIRIMLLLSPKAEILLSVFLFWIFGSVNSIWSFYTINAWLQESHRRISRGDKTRARSVASPCTPKRSLLNQLMLNLVRLEVKVKISIVLTRKSNKQKTDSTNRELGWC